MRHDRGRRHPTVDDPIVAGLTSANHRLAEAVRRWSSAVPVPDPVEVAVVIDVLDSLSADSGVRADPLDAVAAFERSNQSRRAEWSATIDPEVTRSIRGRWRSVERAHLRLGRSVAAIDYDLGDLPGDFVRLELRDWEMVWCARRSLGMTSLPPAAVRLDPAVRLGWLMGIVEVPGLAPSGLVDVMA